ncbi:MACPF domain-containing protein At4g24290-like isoform X2 [Gastrolobium bilobum]|uniref:MACPF domain-containing protein At4g24290-like isoform X2 n=1 Tax=Gastrolobium bilobum TaxID=150636 RepID=UPI002AB0DABD|nr:MACPF domain-containing protein At4g24290-like isoform X2 [Gastrolobium bilobum]
MAPRVSSLQAAQKAVNSIGLGFDITQDINFDNCKRGSKLILVNEELCRHLEIPGGVSIPNVPNSIKCVRGESIRIQSEALTLQQMLEHFNQQMCLVGKTASGHFCASFGLSGRCIKGLASIKSLAYDGWFIKRYAIELERYHGELHEHVKEAVPSSWDPEALARFIERFGTHVIVGVSMGAKDVLYVRQEDTSYLHPTSIQKLLKDTANMKFMDSAENHCLASEDLCNQKENLFVIHCRRGGSIQKMYHSEWLDTIDSEPDVISMFLLPLTSLLKSIRGSGFVSHAINLYLRYKPPIEDLHQFFEFQLPRQWAPVLREIRLGSHWKQQVNTWLRFSFLGPKLYINTIPVDVGNRPVIGLRLQLEGRRSNRLAIHLQHLASLPKSLPLSDNANAYLSCDSYHCNLHKKVKWNCFSYVCTALVESDDSLSIVTGAQLQVEKKCLLLRLRFSKVIGATLQKPPEWDQSSSLGQFSSKSGGIFAFISKEGQRGHPKPGDKTIGSTTYSTARPAPVHTPKLQRFVDTTEMIRGPEDTPGYWVVSGARLSVQNGKIHLLVKYSLLSFVMQSC